MRLFTFLSQMCVLLFICIGTLNAQTEKKYIALAEEAIKDGDRITALENYLLAYQKNATNPITNYAIGKLYLQTTYSHKALPYILNAEKQNIKIDKEYYFYLGWAYHVLLKFDDAITAYTNFKNSLKADDKAIIKRVDRRIYECNNGKEFVADPVPVKIENIGNVINSKYADFAPVISANEQIMIFTSRRPGGTGEETDETGQFFEDIYISRMVNGKWSTPINIGTNINTDSHDASIGLSADGNELLIYKDDGGGDIYYCKMRKDSSWSKPLPIEGAVNSRKSYENAAAISPDGKTLFFASNIEGGFGGLDIYMVHMNKQGFWGTPINLGTTINTEDDDEAPFMDFDGKTLYFSSRSHKGMGGYDIYKTEYDSIKKDWTTPLNMGYPINSADDDVYFVLSGDGAHGYYASAKEDGFGEKDIYRIVMPPRDDRHLLIEKMKEMNLFVAKEEPKPIVTSTVEPAPVIVAVILPVLIKGTITDGNTKQPLSAMVQLVDNKGNVLSTMITSGDGKYSFELSPKQVTNYTITASKIGFGFIDKNIAVPAAVANKQEMIVDLTLKPLVVGSIIVLRNIYFDFDKAIIKSESKNELQKLLDMMRNNPTMKVELGGHTDAKGSNEYNISLSQRRANAVVDWLVKNGIDRNRLVPKGYGEEKPLVSNDDEQDGREINRRTEFKVLAK
jgi:outer membrane protein OmpA-like peptidoglycan-associated protein/tetratricopeptide (TPR) repeat protein